MNKLVNIVVASRKTIHERSVMWRYCMCDYHRRSRQLIDVVICYVIIAGRRPQRSTTDMDLIDNENELDAQLCVDFPIPALCAEERCGGRPCVAYKGDKDGEEVGQIELRERREHVCGETRWWFPSAVGNTLRPLHFQVPPKLFRQYTWV